MKIKVLRRYANKTALAARKDTFINKSKLSPKENYGNELKKLIADKVDKIKNDVQPILKKPLPRPDDKPSKKKRRKKSKKNKEEV